MRSWSAHGLGTIRFQPIIISITSDTEDPYVSTFHNALAPYPAHNGLLDVDLLP